MQQFVEILLAMSIMFMNVSGFVNLGGCECGCGVSCKNSVGYPYARWVCPGSVGYACDPDANTITATFSASLLYEPEPAVVPCTVQNDAVKWVTALFMFGLPGVCGLLAILPIRAAVITKAEHEKIIEGIEALKSDPNAHVRSGRILSTTVHPPCHLTRRHGVHR